MERAPFAVSVVDTAARIEVDAWEALDSEAGLYTSYTWLRFEETNPVLSAASGEDGGVVIGDDL